VAQFIRNFAEKAPALVKSAATYSKPQSAAFGDKIWLDGITDSMDRSLTTELNSVQAASFNQLPVKAALLGGLVTTELWMWFHGGEIIAKCGIIGCDV
uniref:ATP synthase subunit n=1 Tax=Bos indicus x Bos taurus TaxID=30522 RepID=A0A4W2GGJ8_BOBOX